MFTFHLLSFYLTLDTVRRTSLLFLLQTSSQFWILLLISCCLHVICQLTWKRFSSSFCDFLSPPLFRPSQKLSDSLECKIKVGYNLVLWKIKRTHFLNEQICCKVFIWRRSKWTFCFGCHLVIVGQKISEPLYSHH